MITTTYGAMLPHASCILAYTDGSCGPQKGGACAVILLRYIDGEETKRAPFTDGAIGTTNIRMEMMGVITALKQIKRDEPLPIVIRTDNQMLAKGWSEWLPGWIAKDWRKADGKPVENQDLWQEILRLADGLSVKIEWVRGHAGDPLNAEADHLATKARVKWDRRAVQAMFGQPA